MDHIERLQAYGQTVVFPNSSATIERLDVGRLRVSDTLVFLDAFWPLEDDLIAYSPRVQVGDVDLEVLLTTIELGERDGESPRRQLAAGVTLRVSDQAPERWTQLADEHGDPALIPVDNASIVLFDLAEAEQLRLEQAKVNAREMYAGLIDVPLARLGDAVVIRCGKGDGAYGIWLGYAGTQLAQTVVDLQLFDGAEVR